MTEHNRENCPYGSGLSLYTLMDLPEKDFLTIYENMAIDGSKDIIDVAIGLRFAKQITETGKMPPTAACYECEEYKAKACIYLAISEQVTHKIKSFDEQLLTKKIKPLK